MLLDQAHRLVEAIEIMMVEGLSGQSQERLAADLQRCKENLSQHRPIP
jgi:hypothetical protein